ncbi:2,5-didehydrogluconate reductase B, partial [Aduncisulcus paluster]
HDATAAQVALKWLLDQDGVAAIPKASRAESQSANLDALKVELDDDDRKVIAALRKDMRCVNPVAVAPDHDRSVMVVMPAAMPTTVVAHLGARAPAAIPVMVMAALDHDGLGVRDRRNGHCKRADRCKNKTNLFHFVLLK